MIDTSQIETVMYQISNLLLPPVLIVIGALFLYAFFVLGVFAAQYWQRSNNSKKYQQAIQTMATDVCNMKPVKGYRLFSHFQGYPTSTTMDLEIFAIKNLEKQRIVTRIAPMLGLVATMIPMGPALKSLADGNIQGISENLMIAFAAVIFGLVTASITFWTASVKKRWLVEELNDLQPHLEPSS
ncbi:MAG: MotA/TolQ/ExbB proton channel family protein [Gammaproteobacteria bacterium]|nr:MotA/TolQ/ExbB proton channel family protein [Gammaproteobacteria bacterium]